MKKWLNSPNSPLCRRSDLITPGMCRTEGASGGPGPMAVAGHKERTLPASESSGCTTSRTLSKSRRRGGAPRWQCDPARQPTQTCMAATCWSNVSTPRCPYVTIYHKLNKFITKSTLQCIKMLINSDSLLMHWCPKSMHNRHRRRLVEAELPHHLAGGRIRLWLDVH
jgi:hypothetical protein